MKREQFEKRKIRRRKILKSKSQRSRLVVFRSNKHIYAQIIDDKKGKTLVAAWDGEVGKLKAQSRRKVGIPIKASGSSKLKTTTQKSKLNKIEIAGLVGEKIAEKAKKLKIKEVVFDKGGYKYHGQVKSLAEGARKGGLKF